MDKKAITQDCKKILQDIIINKQAVDDIINIINIKSAVELINVNRRYKLSSIAGDLQSAIESLDDFIKSN